MGGEGGVICLPEPAMAQQCPPAAAAAAAAAAALSLPCAGLLQVL
eukprot:COSAG01_NODE_17227_length_1168_cov_1.217025_3_plen_44_part_01